MRAVVLTPRAAVALDEIWEFVSRDNPTAADRLIARIRRATTRLARLPLSGHRRRDVRDARYRFWPIGQYLIAYRFDESTLTIVRVLHGARDIRAEL